MHTCICVGMYIRCIDELSAGANRIQKGYCIFWDGAVGNCEPSDMDAQKLNSGPPQEQCMYLVTGKVDYLAIFFSLLLLLQLDMALRSLMK